MLELAILGLLKEEPMHGYQLSKELTETLGGFRRVSYGSLYPTLRRLEKAGEVEATAASGEKSARRKQVYRITPAGEIAFDDMLSEAGQDVGEDSKFGMRLAFFRYLKPEKRIRLLERRRAFLEDRLVATQAQLAKTHEKIDFYTLSMMNHGQDATRSDIAWVDELIAGERSTVEASITAAHSTPRTTSDSTPTSSAAIKTRAQARAARRKERKS